MEIVKAAQLETNPAIEAWAEQPANQLGSVTMGWGLFIIALAWTGIGKESKGAWYVLWIGGAPTALASSVQKIVRYGWSDSGSTLNLAALSLLCLGLLLPIKSIVRKKAEPPIAARELKMHSIGRILSS